MEQEFPCSGETSHPYATTLDSHLSALQTCDDCAPYSLVSSICRRGRRCLPWWNRQLPAAVSPAEESWWPGLAPLPWAPAPSAWLLCRRWEAQPDRRQGFYNYVCLQTSKNGLELLTQAHNPLFFRLGIKSPKRGKCSDRPLCSTSPITNSEEIPVAQGLVQTPSQAFNSSHCPYKEPVCFTVWLHLTPST